MSRTRRTAGVPKGHRLLGEFMDRKVRPSNGFRICSPVYMTFFASFGYARSRASSARVAFSMSGVLACLARCRCRRIAEEFRVSSPASNHFEDFLIAVCSRRVTRSARGRNSAPFDRTSLRCLLFAMVVSGWFPRRSLCIARSESTARFSNISSRAYDLALNKYYVDECTIFTIIHISRILAATRRGWRGFSTSSFVDGV